MHTAVLMQPRACVCVRVRCFVCGHVRAVAVERDSVSTSTSVALRTSKVMFSAHDHVLTY